jgi:hypothetical protein
MTIQKLTSQAQDFSSLREAIEYYFEQGWTDGLPVIPPTEEEVEEFLKYTSLGPGDSMGVVPVNNQEVAVEKVAINAAMAGCKPEYMPVVMAAVEAILDPAFNLHINTISTSGAAIMLIVNGPARRRLEFNTGTGLFGPGFRANATIGRAMRLIQINVCGAVAGVLNLASLGHPGQYTMCIAEDEEFSPWEPFQVTRGYSASDSTVTALGCFSPFQVINRYSDLPEGILTTYADAIMGGPTDQAEIVLIVPRQFMTHIKRAGWPRRQVQEYLYQATQRPAREWARVGQMSPDDGENLGEELIHSCQSPEGFYIIPAGGSAGVEGAFISTRSVRYRGSAQLAVTRKIDMSKL